MTPPLLSYYIRDVADLNEEHYHPPRTPVSVRRNLDGSKCIVAFSPGSEPPEWPQAMTREQLLEIINAPEAAGIWYEAE